jgi:hypothetical protein
MIISLWIKMEIKLLCKKKAEETSKISHKNMIKKDKNSI